MADIIARFRNGFSPKLSTTSAAPPFQNLRPNRGGKDEMVSERGLAKYFFPTIFKGFHRSQFHFIKLIFPHFLVIH